MTEKALVAQEPHRPGLIRPIAQPDELIGAHKELVAIIESVLESGKDYAVIPGTQSPTLTKAGGERLLKAFGCHAEYSIVEREIDHDKEMDYQGKYDKASRKVKGLYRYIVSCTIYSYDGHVVGNQVGSCSSLESKYRGRPSEVENTILKMAQKRALVGAVLNAFGLSDRFTQDMEDSEDEKKAQMLRDRGVPEDKISAVRDAMAGKKLSELPVVLGALGIKPQAAAESVG